MKLRLRYPATPKNAADHAELAVSVAAEESDTTYKRLELGDSEFLPALFHWAARGARGAGR